MDPPTECIKCLNPNKSFLNLLEEEQPFLVVQDLKEEGLRGLTLLHGLSLVQYLLRLPCVADLEFAPFPLLVFLLEKLLRDLGRRECFPTPIFFRNEQTPLNSYQRSVLWLVERHLEHLADIIHGDLRPRVFDCATNADWEDFLKDSSPSVALALLPEETFPTSISICLEIFTTSCLDINCNIAPLDDVEFHGGTILGPLLRSLDVPKEVQDAIRAECASIKLLPVVPTSIAVTTLPSQCVLAALGCVVKANQGDEIIQLQARVALLSHHLQERLSLQQRSLPYVDAKDLPQHTRFCELFFEQLWCHFRVAQTPQGTPVLDLFDVNLFRHTLLGLCASRTPSSRTLSSFLSLSTAAVSICEAQWKSLKADTIWDLQIGDATLSWIRALPTFLRLRPLRTANSSDLASPAHVCDCKSTLTEQPVLKAQDVESWEEIEVPAASALVPAATLASPHDLVFPLHSPLLSMVLKHQLPHLREDHQVVQEALTATKRFEEKWHWHSLRPLTEPSWKQKKSM